VPRASAVRSIANLAVSDAPVFLAEKDELGFTPVARAIAGLLRNKATGLPLTVAINAPWGRGKTSLMSLVQQELKASGWRTVWFNAWHHQEETSMLASLLQTVRLKAPPELMTRGGLRYRVQLLAKRLWHWRTLWTIAAVVALYLGEAVVHDHNPHMYVNGEGPPVKSPGLPTSLRKSPACSKWARKCFWIWPGVPRKPGQDI